MLHIWCLSKRLDSDTECSMCVAVITKEFTVTVQRHKGAGSSSLETQGLFHIMGQLGSGIPSAKDRYHGCLQTVRGHKRHVEPQCQIRTSCNWDQCLWSSSFFPVLTCLYVGLLRIHNQRWIPSDGKSTHCPLWFSLFLSETGFWPMTKLAIYCTGKHTIVCCQWLQQKSVRTECLGNKHALPDFVAESGISANVISNYFVADWLIMEYSRKVTL